jgi:hypothetical protein
MKMKSASILLQVPLSHRGNALVVLDIHYACGWFILIRPQTNKQRNSLKNGVFWVVTPCGSCKNRRFGGTYRLHHQSEKNQQGRNNVGSN